MGSVEALRQEMYDDCIAAHGTSEFCGIIGYLRMVNASEDCIINAAEGDVGIDQEQKEVYREWVKTAQAKKVKMDPEVVWERPTCQEKPWEKHMTRCSGCGTFLCACQVVQTQQMRGTYNERNTKHCRTGDPCTTAKG